METARSISEVTLYMAKNILNSPVYSFAQHRNIPVKPLKSEKYHPNSILFYRRTTSGQVTAPSFLEDWKKTIMLVNFNCTDLENLQTHLNLYQEKGFRVILVLQEVRDVLESAQFSQDTTFNKEFYEEWICQLMLKNIYCIETDSFKETQAYLRRIVSFLNGGPYKTQHTSFQTTTKKLSAATTIPLESQSFAKQLICIPGVSETKAAQIVNKYPSASALLETYNDPCLTTTQKEMLLANLGNKTEKTLSKRIYLYYTAKDPSVTLT